MKTKHLTLWATNKETGYRFIASVTEASFSVIMETYKNLSFDITESYY